MTVSFNPFFYVIFTNYILYIFLILVFLSNIPQVIWNF